MKLTLNKKSWHYWVATNIDSWNGARTEEYNICAYMKSVAKGLLALAFGVTIMSIILVPLFAGLYFLVGHYIFHFVDHANELEQGGLLLIVVGLIGTVCSASFQFARERAAEKRMEKRQAERAGVVESDSFITHAWHSLREKTCVSIEFKE